MIPIDFDDSTTSAAERKLFELLKHDPETAEWTVLHSLGLARRGRKPFGEIDFVVLHAPKAMDSELKPFLVDLNQTLDFDEVVPVKGVHHLCHVVPHLGFQFAGAIGKLERKIGFTSFLLANLFGGDDKLRSSDFVRH